LSGEIRWFRYHSQPSKGRFSTRCGSSKNSCLDNDFEPESALAFQHYKGWYNAISKSAISLVPRKDRFIGVVYNSIDCSQYPFNHGKRGDYLLYFSRFSPEKGAHVAIKIARELGYPLILAGNIADPDYFKENILPFVDEKKIRCETEVSPERKLELMMNAKCLLAPITWPEPFGIFMVEAQACGTPVIAYGLGAAPEIIEHGRTGFIAKSFPEMVSYVKLIDQIDSRKCRQLVLDKFDVPQLADGYLAVYRSIISKTVAAAPKVVVKN
jgi:glycosyltransferase involved in cell wall biosynthesis